VLASIPLALNGIPVMASGSIENALDVLANAAVNCGGSGYHSNEWGNDGLNTVFL
jgi:hypothetical protein